MQKLTQRPLRHRPKCKPESVKLLEENIRETLCYPGLRKDLLDTIL